MSGASGRERGAPRIAVTDCDHPDVDVERAVVAAAGFAFEVHRCRTAEDVVATCADADGLLVQYAPLTDAAFAALPRCRVVVRYGVGVDTVDVEAATRHGVAVCNVPDYGVEEVSDHAIALLLAIARRVPDLDRSVRQGEWNLAAGQAIRRLRGRTVGVVGLGRIGRATARKAAALGFAVIGHDPMAGEPQPGIERVDLPELLARADVVTLHLPLTPATRHLIDGAALARMHAGALLVNTARGGLVDTAALVRALAEGRLAGAALDVTEPEPLPPDHPLLALPNVVVTPHAGWYSQDSFVELKTKAAEEAVAVLAERAPRYCLNPVVLRG